MTPHQKSTCRSSVMSEASSSEHRKRHSRCVEEFVSPRIPRRPAQGGGRMGAGPSTIPDTTREDDDGA